MIDLRVGDCREVLATLPPKSIQCCVTSPPYFGLRDYGTAQWDGGDPECDHRNVTQGATSQRAGRSYEQGTPYGHVCGKCGAVRIDRQMGLEPTLAEYITGMVDVFRLVRDVLADDGTVFLNVGDSYFAGAQRAGKGDEHGQGKRGAMPVPMGLKPKDLMMVPARLAIALQEPYYTGRIKNESDRVWLAAMIDAEGCMYIHKRGEGLSNGQGYTRKNATYSSGMEVSNTSRAIVERCMEIAQCGSICEQTNGRKQTLYRWNLRSNECRDIVREVYPYLIGKQHQARLLCGCPSSGDLASAMHQGLMNLHNGDGTTTDCPPPTSVFEQGWFLRSDIIWKKPNPMPESVTDRPTSAHEHIFLLTKSARYYYCADAIRTEITSPTTKMPDGWDTGPGSHGSFHRNGREKGERIDKQSELGKQHADVRNRNDRTDPMEIKAGANARNVWSIATHPFPGAHFATFPPEIPRRCILAGSREGDTVLDPFAGAGTTGLVADRLGRNAILIELNPEYAEMARERIRNDAPLFAEVTP